MSEPIDLSRPDALELLNAANGDARFYLGTPEHGLADYPVRDRTLFGQPDVVARYFGLPDAIADVARRNEEARRETVARQMDVYLAIRAGMRPASRQQGPSYAGIGATFIAVFVAAGLAILGLTAAGANLAHAMGWLP